MCVFVIGLTGKQLMPTTPRKARMLLKNGKAEVYSKNPFTIKLNYKTGGTVQDVSLGIDTGSQHIGIAIVSNSKVLYKAEVTLRSSMSKRKLMETRKEYRRGRRYRKVRYRKPKFRHHTKRIYCEKPFKKKGKFHHWKKVPFEMDTNRQKGWLPPSIQSKVDHHFRWIDKYLDVLPTNTRLVVEVSRFDIAHMQNPEIRGEMYQHGPQYEFENVKAYVFSRDDYKCKICNKKAGTVRENLSIVKLKAHHVLFRSESATDNPEFMVTVCDVCHTDAAHKPGGILYEWEKQNKKFTRGLRDATFMNIFRSRMFKKYPHAIFTYGNITAVDRKRSKLDKSHGNDAVAIAMRGKDEQITSSTDYVYIQQVRKKKRSLHEANPRKGLKAPNKDAKRNKKNTKALKIVAVDHPDIETIRKQKNIHLIEIPSAKEKIPEKTIALYDKVFCNHSVGWVTNFSGASCRIVDKNGKYLTKPAKKEGAKENNLFSVSEIKVLQHNNNWIMGVVVTLGKQ